MLIWYAIQTNPRCERRVIDGLREHGFTVFCPMETHWKRGRTKKRERVDSPLFVGYVFFGLGPWQSIYHARLIDGVRGLVSVAGAPLEIPPALIYDLQARQAAGEFDHTPPIKCTYRPGDKAKVKLDGPYRDLIGEVLKATEGGRVELMLCASLNWKTTIDSDHLEEVPKAA